MKRISAESYAEVSNEDPRSFFGREEFLDTLEDT